MPAAGSHHSGGTRVPRLKTRGAPAGFYYLGPVFRYRGGQASEFNQAGVESFGRQDRAAADAEMLALGLEAAAAFGVTGVDIRTGDVALFAALIEALDLYPVWKRRLIKDFNRKVSLAQDLQRLTLETGKTRNEYEGVLAALAGSDRKAALALVTDLMSIAGTSNVGGRTVSEIADRFLEQSTLKGGALPRDALKLIERFLAIAGEPDRRGGATARAGIGRETRPQRRHRPVRKPHRIHGRARHRDESHPLLHVVRPRPRLLHRFRVRTAPQGQRHRAAGRRRDATTGC